MNPFIRFQRMWQIATTARKHGLDAELEPYLKLPAARHLFRLLLGERNYDETKPYAVRLREALQELGPIFIKFGQMISMRPDMFPDHIVKGLMPLQDQVQPFSSASARNVIEESLGASVDVVFSRFDDIPIASASVSQVHNAVLQNGDDVVVKVLRPGIDKMVDSDLKIMMMFAWLFNVFWPKHEQYSAIEVVQSYADTLTNSLDLTVEAASANQFRTLFKDDQFLYVPRVYWEYTRSSVLVMERVSGFPIRDVESIKAAGVDLTRLAENIVNSFFVQVFYHGFFHGDLHPGNLLISEEGTLNIVDFGIMGSLSNVDRNYLADNITAILRRDYKAVVDTHIRSGWAPHDISVEQFEISIRTVCEPFLDQTVGQQSFGKLMGRMFRMFRDFDIKLQPQLLLFQKTYLSVEGLTRMLDPQVNISDTVRPILKDWIGRQYKVQGLRETIKAELPYWLTSMPELPRLAHEALSELQAERIRNKKNADAQSATALEKIYRRVFYLLIGGVAFIGMVIDWLLDGIGFTTLIALIVIGVCLKIAWPEND